MQHASTTAAVVVPENLVALLGSVLRNEVADGPRAGDDAAIASILEAAQDHGVLPLFDASFQSATHWGSWPKEILEACHQARLAQTGFEVVHATEIDRVLVELAGVGITPLLLKGTGLAYGLYPSPALRPRSDSDLLVAPEMRDAAWAKLQALGYRRVGGPAGRFVGYQLLAQRRDPRGIVHNIDLHWRLRDEQAFAWLFSFAELAAAAVPVPAINRHAMRLGNAHSLLLSLLHRASNNVLLPGFGDRLIWLHDMHLLVEAMSPAELDAFRGMVAAKGVGALALDGLQMCSEQLPSPRIAALIDTLARSPGARSGAMFLTAGRLRREWMEFTAIPKLGARLDYLAARAFPSPEYMRERYPESGASPLPILYARRGWTGIARLFLRRGAA